MSIDMKKIFIPLIIALITAIILFIIRVIAFRFLQKSGLLIPTTGLTYGLLKGIIIIIGLLIILSSLGISITPLITALGVGGLAVALALQDTLANLFAGIHILAEKSIRL